MSDMTLFLCFLVILLTLLLIGLLSYITSLKQKLAEQQYELDMIEVKFENLHLAFDKEKRLAIDDAKKRSRTSQRNKIKGDLGERFTPYMGGFPYNPADCRFLGEPIDYIIFHNLHECSEGLVPIEAVEIIIADVKTGNARLSKRQQILKYIIANGQVRFETFRVQEIDSFEVEIEG